MTRKPKTPLLIYQDACTAIYEAKGLKIIPKSYTEFLTNQMGRQQLGMIVSDLLTDELMDDARDSALQDILSRVKNKYTITLLVTIDRNIRKDAALLRRRARYYNKTGRSPKLKLKDSLHLQAAMVMDATEFHTYDDKILKLHPRVLGDSGLRVTTPNRSPLYLRYCLRQTFRTNLLQNRRDYLSNNDHVVPHLRRLFVNIFPENNGNGNGTN